MKLAIGILLLTSPLFATLSAGARPAEMQWQQVGKRLRASTDLHVRFTQQVLTLRKKIRRMHGEAYFSTAGKFRWLMKQPKKQQQDKSGQNQEQQIIQAYIYDGKTVVEHLPQEKLANVWSVGSGQVAEISRIVQLVKTLDNLEREYKIKETPSMDALLLTLTPHKTDGIKQILLRIGKADTFISYLKIEYRVGRYSEYRFSQPVHKKLPANHFTFVPPVGTKVMLIN